MRQNIQKRLWMPRTCIRTENQHTHTIYYSPSSIPCPSWTYSAWRRLRSYIRDYPPPSSIMWIPVDCVCPVYRVILSSHLVLGFPLPRPPSTVPYIIMFASPLERLTCPYHSIFHRFTTARRCSWGPIAAVISPLTDSFVYTIIICILIYIFFTSSNSANIGVLDRIGATVEVINLNFNACFLFVSIS